MFFFYNNQHPEFILFDNIKEESEEDDVEMESSYDSTRDNLETQTNVEDKSLSEEKLSTVKREKHEVTKKTADKRSKTIPLITPTTQIVPVNCNETVDQDESPSNKDRPKESIKHHYAKKPKMCTVCGKLVKWGGFPVKEFLNEKQT